MKLEIRDGLKIMVVGVCLMFLLSVWVWLWPKQKKKIVMMATPTVVVENKNEKIEQNKKTWQEWIKKLKIENVAEPDFEYTDGIVTYDLETTKLVEVALWPGAYQPGFLLFLQTANGQSKKLILTDDRSGENSGFIEAAKDKKSFSIWRKYVGHGGCGEENTYVINGEKVVLTKTRKYSDCEKPMIMDQWPVVYQKQL